MLINAVKNRLTKSGIIGLVLFYFFLVGVGFAQPPEKKESSKTDKTEESASQSAPDKSKRHEIGIGAEATFVGLSWGVRVELLSDILGQRQMLRFAPGFLYGLEFLYVPVALGYRGYFGEPSVGVYWIVGAGAEYQLRWVVDGPAVHQGALYLETGVMVRLSAADALSLHATVDWAALGPPGPGMTLRVVYQRQIW